MFRLLIIALLLVGCNQNNVVTPQLSENSLLCHTACNHVRDLKCKQANDLVYPKACSTDNDCKDSGHCLNNKCTETCEELCSLWITQRVYVGVECWQTIKSCDEIENICRK